MSQSADLARPDAVLVLASSVTAGVPFSETELGYERETGTPFSSDEIEMAVAYALTYQLQEAGDSPREAARFVLTSGIPLEPDLVLQMAETLCPR